MKPSPAFGGNKKMNELKTIVVDDNRVFRETLVEYLRTIPGVSVIAQAESGQEAVMKAEILKPDLILMDISMDAMDGLKAASIIKECLPATKIIFITVHEEETYRYLAALAQGDGFVWKNSIDELPIKIKRIQDSLAHPHTQPRQFTEQPVVPQ